MKRLSLVGLVVGALGAGVLLERQVLADGTPSASVSAEARPDFRLMAQAWNLIEKYYVDRGAIQPQRMTHAAISGMVDSLGDTGHSVFLTPQMVREAGEQLQGHFAGIGAEVHMRRNQVVIVAPLDGSPAQKAGLRAGDIIFKVDGKDISGQTLAQLVRRIRGPVGTTVILSVRDPGTDRTRRVAVVRAEIHVHSVSWHLVPGTRIADVRISDFSRGTAKSLRRAIAELRASGARAVVLDLRNDPGGLLQQAVDVASQFLRGGNVLLEKNARGHVEPVAVEDGKTALTLPMVVLVNGGTASAAEIVTGAIQDAGRAVVVGEKTFGTGTVLEQFRLSDGSALMLAVREWLTPDGHTIWHKGIQPNAPVKLGADVAPVYPDTLAGLSVQRLRASKDAQLLKALSLLHSAHSAPAGALPRPGTAAVPGGSARVRCDGAGAGAPHCAPIAAVLGDRRYIRSRSAAWTPLVLA